MMTKSSQKDVAKKALRLKEDGNRPADYLEHQDPASGAGELTALEHEPKNPVPGAFGAEGHRPVLERSRKVR